MVEQLPVHVDVFSEGNALIVQLGLVDSHSGDNWCLACLSALRLLWMSRRLVTAAFFAIHWPPLLLVLLIIICKEFGRKELDVIVRHGIARPATVLTLAIERDGKHQLLGKPLLVIPKVKLQLALTNHTEAMPRNGKTDVGQPQFFCHASQRVLLRVGNRPQVLPLPQLGFRVFNAVKVG